MTQEFQKVAIVTHSLGEGGAERFAATLSRILDGLGFEIHLICIEDRVDYSYAGTLYNLGALCNHLGNFRRKLAKGKLLKKYLQKNKIGIVIDNRARNVFIRDFLAMKIFGRRSVIWMVHSYNIESYLPKSGVLANLLYRNSKLVCVSKTIEDEVRLKYPNLDTTTIYNAVDLPEAEKGELAAEDYMLFFGRLDDKVKNLSLLLDAYHSSRDDCNGLKLYIMGDGPDRELLLSKVRSLNLQDDVRFIPFQNNPLEYVKKARFTVLTSRYEGFPMSVIESLAVGTPVVSVDCKSGPAELIVNRKNGLLVPNHDLALLASAFVELATNGELYHICKNNARESVRHLSVENISRQWKQLLTNLK